MSCNVQRPESVSFETQPSRGMCACNACVCQCAHVSARTCSCDFCEACVCQHAHMSTNTLVTSVRHACASVHSHSGGCVCHCAHVSAHTCSCDFCEFLNEPGACYFDWTDWPEGPKICLFLPPPPALMLGLQAYCHIFHFTRGLGIRTQVLMFAYPPSHLQAHKNPP